MRLNVLFILIIASTVAACLPESFDGRGPTASPPPTAAIPAFEPHRCDTPRGQASVWLSENPALAQQFRELQVDNPKATLEYLAVRSKCFQVVDISRQEIEQQRRLQQARQPQRGSTAGRLPIDYELAIEVQISASLPNQAVVGSPFGGTQRTEIVRESQAQVRMIDAHSRQLVGVGRGTATSVDYRQLTAIVAGSGVGSNVGRITPAAQTVAAAVVLAYDDLVRSFENVSPVTRNPVENGIYVALRQESLRASAADNAASRGIVEKDANVIATGRYEGDLWEVRAGPRVGWVPRIALRQM